MKKIGYAFGAALLLALDLWSKAWVATHIKAQQTIQLIPGFFDLVYLENRGSAWSMFEGMGPVVIVLSVVVAGALVYYFIKKESPVLRVAMMLIFAGNLGNLYDRFFLGYVRDMLSFNIFGYAFPVFNVADVCMVVGVMVIFLYTYLEERKGNAI